MSVLSLIPEDKRKDQRKESLESVYSSNSRLNLLNKRKRINPLTMDASNTSLSKAGDKYVTQRVLSAKTHRVKQLQNQLSDAHYHLQELSNENKVLRAIQKKQEIALQRYENSNAELPTVLNSHNEEMRIQQSKYKQLKQQFKEVTAKLKERDMQLQQLKDEHQHLLELSKDRNLLEREKLQAQVTDLSSKVQQQNETITMLQRRIALEAKNFRHQLQTEINKHKDTRHDLDLAINNADKLTTIIEMKEKMLSTAASRTLKSPVKTSSGTSISKQSTNKARSETDTSTTRARDDRIMIEQNIMAKLCENSRSLSSALSHDEETSSSTEPRSRYARSRSNSTISRSTPTPGARKNSKGSDEVMELAKTVQDGMADLAIFDDDDLRTSPDELHMKMEAMKTELMNKIKSDETPSRKPSALRRKSTEESIEEQEENEEQERPKSRGRRNSNVSFFEKSAIEDSTTTVAIHEGEVEMKFKREASALERKIAGKPIEKYCKDIIQDIEKSSKVIDKHMKCFNQSRFESDKLVQQLEAVDKINEFVNANGEIPESALNELNNNFKMLTDQVFTDVIPVGRKRSISGRRGSKESKTNLLGDANMTNQDLLDDLLGKK
ncbi:hypothetical protein B5X24_HaOG202338 [Helicoverpa armigera]|uniref:Lebercilin domain-containing protein n=1 Tax=Helicoverpa armigera TaxID=29058 RepID=A0A2W1BZW2_HELAM|nr:hypothetical protein B5X24_HaOG202338 [Helicoverpa armigera]